MGPDTKVCLEKQSDTINSAELSGSGAVAQGKDTAAAGERGVVANNIDRVHTGDIFYVAEKINHLAIYKETFENPGFLYDRKRLLDEGYQTLATGKHLWISANASRGRTRLVVELARRCLGLKDEPPLFADSLYLEKLGTFEHFLESVKWLRIFQVIGILLIIDDVDWPSSQIENLTSWLEETSLWNWQAVVISSELVSEKWYVIPMVEQLAQNDVKRFVRDYSLDCSDVRSELECVGEDQWWPIVYKRTEGHVGKLLAVLRGMKNGKPFSEALKEADKPVEERVEEAMSDLNPESLHVLKALSFFATSANLEILKCISKLSSEELKLLLDELIQQSLVETLLAKDEAKRYKLVSEKKEIIIGQFKQVGDVFARFIDCWLNYAWKNGRKEHNRYPQLSREYKNLVGDGSVLDELRTRAMGQPMDRKAAKQYLNMRKWLRDYLRYEGRWTDFRAHSESAYEVALALNKKEPAAQAAFDAAWSYSLEGWCSKESLREATQWVWNMEDVINEGELPEPDKWRAAAHERRGVLKIRDHEYQGALDHFNRALHLLEKYDQSVEWVCEEIENVHFYLAKSEMCLSPDFDSEDCYERAMKHLEEALKSAKSRKNSEENQALTRTKMAELMIWWGKWTKAEQVLEEVLPLSRKLGRKDLLAKGLYLQAFIRQHESERVSDRDEKLEWLYKAIQSAKNSLENLLNAEKRQGDTLLLLCSTYLLLAGLHRSQHEISSAGCEASQSYLDKANGVLKFRSYGIIGAKYEEACSEAIAGNLDKAVDLLFESLSTRFGWCNRAANDFRLASLGKRRWKIIENLGNSASEPQIWGSPT